MCVHGVDFRRLQPAERRRSMKTTTASRGAARVDPTACTTRRSPIGRGSAEDVSGCNWWAGVVSVGEAQIGDLIVI